MYQSEQHLGTSKYCKELN